MIENFNTYWITGTPRVGSMLIYNIAREILLIKQVMVQPDQVLENTDDTIQIYKNNALKDNRTNVKYVFKVHRSLNINIPKSKFIVNKRNPFDICASFYEFMKCDLDSAVEVAKNHTSTIKHYQKFDKNNVMFLEYEKIETNLPLVIKNIATFLGHELDDQIAQKIAVKFSKEAVNKIINDLHKNYSKHANYPNISSENILKKFQNHEYHIFDKHTGFQTAHISKRKSGEWFKAFNTEQISIVKREITPFAKEMGYS